MTELVPLEDIIERLMVIDQDIEAQRMSLGITSVHEDRNFTTVHALLGCVIRILRWME